MSNIRLFFDESLSLNLISKLNKSQSHYLSKVMRANIGQSFSLFNKSGEWEAKILEINKGIIEFSITSKLRSKNTEREIWLAFAPIKLNYQNLMIQTNLIHSSYKCGVKKLIFLGSSCIYPKYAAQPIKESSLLTGKLENTKENWKILEKIGKNWKNLRNTWKLDRFSNFPKVFPIISNILKLLPPW